MATAGFGRVARLFGGAADLFKTLVRGGRRGLNTATDIGGDIAARISGKKKAIYGGNPELMNLRYPDIVRIEAHVRPENLAKLNEDIANSPLLGVGLQLDPSRAKQWKHWDDIGETAMRRRFEEIRTIGKGNRPPVTDYLSPRYIADHKAQFDDGAVRFVNEDDFLQYGVPKPDGTEFVMTKAEADRVWAETGGDPVKLAKALGFEPDHFVNSPVVRIDFCNPAALGVDVPIGNEFGANPCCIPGGVLPDGSVEAVINPTPGSWTHEVL